jgi:hypothetical protein
MPTHVAWHDEDARILRLDYTGKLTMDELRAATKEVLAYLEVGPTYLLINTKDIHLPAGAFIERSSNNFMKHPNTTLIAVIQENAAIQYLARMFGGQRVIIRSTFDEALNALIERMREMGVYQH